RSARGTLVRTRWSLSVRLNVRILDPSLEGFSQNLVRGPQTQRRKSQRRIGGRDGRERAAADQIEIFVVVRALERIDHRIFAIFAHAMGSHDVPGAEILYAGLLARWPFERARIVGLGFRELFRVHALENSASRRFRRRQATLGVFGEIVGNMRSRQAEVILELVGHLVGHRHPIGVVRGLLDQKTEPKLARQLVVQRGGQSLAEQRLTVLVEPAAVQSVDKIDGRGVGILDRKIPTLVADFDPERAAVAAELAVAADLDPGRRERSAIAPDRLGRPRPSGEEWVGPSGMCPRAPCLRGGLPPRAGSARSWTSAAGAAFQCHCPPGYIVWPSSGRVRPRLDSPDRNE